MPSDRNAIDNEMNAAKAHERRIDVEVYPGRVRVMSSQQSTFRSGSCRVPPRRRPITGFSRGSRYRMIKMISSIDVDQMPPPLFVTLTYPARYPRRTRTIVRDLRWWLEACKRDGIDANVWRIEFQKRGAPHFHFLLWPDPHSGTSRARLARNMRKRWRRVVRAYVDRDTAKGRLVNVQECWDAIGVLWYMTKPEPEGYSWFKGRRWGSSRNLPTRSLAKVSLDPIRASMFVDRVAEALRVQGNYQAAVEIRAGRYSNAFLVSPIVLKIIDELTTASNSEE